MSQYHNPKHHNKTRWIYKLHRHLMKPPYPVMLPCPNCMRPLIEVNATTVELENGFGFGTKELIAKDAWSLIKHNCGTKVTIYWSE